MKNKVLVVCQHYWPESFRLNDVCDYLIEQGFTVDVLCGIPNYPQGKFFKGYSVLHNRRQRHNGVRVERVFEIPRGKSSKVRIFLNNASFSIASIFHVPRLLTRKYDKIFIYQLSPITMSLPGIIIGKLKRVETIMWVIDPWPESLFSFLDSKNWLFKIVLTRISHWHYRQINKFIAPSKRVQKKLIEVTGLSNKMVKVLPQACEKIYEERILDKQLQEKFRGGFNIFFAGTITPILSFETVIDAAIELKKRGYDNINWVIVGDGMSSAWLKEEVKKYGIYKNFFFEGYKPKEEIPKYTTSVADVLYSGLVKNELLEATIPAKITSYLAAGKPLILSMDGEANELINKTIRCGFAGPAEDSMTLADNIEKMYLLPEKKRKELGDRAREFHFKNYERNVVMNEFKKFMMGDS